MVKLVWKKTIQKPLTEEERQEMGSNDSGVSYVKNMNDQDAKKWVVDWKGKCLSIQKTQGGVHVSITIGNADSHPKLNRWDLEETWSAEHKTPWFDTTLYKASDIIITIGQNGTSRWTPSELKELNDAIDTALDYFKRGVGLK